MRKAKFKRGKKITKKRILVALIGIVVVGSVAFFGYLFFITKQYAFVSPLPGKGFSFIEKSSVTKDAEAELQKNHISFKKVIKSSDDAITITLADDTRVVISPNKSIALQISSLQLVLHRLTIEGKKFASLDFRFDKPIVTLR